MSESEVSHRGFSFRALRHRLGSMPALLVALPLVVGVLLHAHVLLPFRVVTLMVALLLIVAVWLRSSSVASIMLVGAALALGYVIAEVRSPRCKVPYDCYLELVVRLDEIPSARSDYRLSEGCIEFWRSDSTWYKSGDNVLVWLRADTLAEGDRVMTVGRVSKQMSRIESYDRLLRNRGFVGGVGIDESLIIDIEHGAESLHSRSVRKLERYMRDTLSHATSEAMVVGSKRLMSQHLRDIYSRTGLAHLMAVSGLHLGIVMLIIGWILRPLVLLHRGYQLRSLLIVALLWVYVFVSGGSASVVRAALMFSILQLANASSLHYSSLNSLLVAIIAMVVYRPNYVYDISFQLSVLAVVGIVVWGVPAMRLLSGNGSVVWWLLSTIAISVVATLWTMPIVSHTFGAIPLVGIVVTPVAMLLSYVIIGSGLFALLLPHPMALPFARVMDFVSNIENIIVERAASWHLASIDCQMTSSEVAIIYGIYALITLAMWSINEKSDNFATR